MKTLDKPKKKIAAIILAAGRSSRLRRPKQLVVYNGMTLIRHVAMTCIFSDCDKVFVILGAFQKNVKREVRFLDVDIIRNPLWFKGMGASIKLGVKRVFDRYREMDGLLILLCDQPLVSEDHLNKLMEEFQKGADIVASKFAGTFGVPAVFSQTFAKELLEISDGEGAKSFLEQRKDKVHFIDFPGGEFDIDTTSDLEKLQLLVNDEREGFNQV